MADEEIIHTDETADTVGANPGVHGVTAPAKLLPGKSAALSEPRGRRDQALVHHPHLLRI
jgi:hypothetical protein